VAVNSRCVVLTTKCGPSSCAATRGRSDLDAGQFRNRRLDLRLLVDVRACCRSPPAAPSGAQPAFVVSRCADCAKTDNAGAAGGWRGVMAFAHIVGPLGDLHRGNRIGSLRLRHVFGAAPQGREGDYKPARMPPDRRQGERRDPDASATPAAPLAPVARHWCAAACF